MNSILIIIPTLNSLPHIQRLINSLKSQKSKKWRAIFVDGMSSQKNRLFIKKICKEEKNFSWVAQTDFKTGIYGAMNQGFDLAKKNEWTFFWGSDDWTDNSKLIQNCLDLIEKCEKDNLVIDMIIFRGRYRKNPCLNKGRKAYFLATKETKIINKKTYIRGLLLGLTPPHQCSLISPRLRKLKSKYSSKFKLAADLDYFLNIKSIQELNILLINKNIVNILEGGESAKNSFKRINEVYLAYSSAFPLLWFVPFIMRYVKKIILVIKEI